MLIFPFEKTQLSTVFTEDELCGVIDRASKPWNAAASVQGSRYPLFGQRLGRRFKLFRTGNQRNTFMPLAVGEILTGDSGVYIAITYRLSWPVMAILTVWFGFFLSWLLVSVSAGALLAALLPLCMCLFAYLVVLTLFRRELARLKGVLAAVLQRRDDGQLPR